MDRKDNKIYPIDSSELRILYELTEFTPNSMPKYSFSGTIHFKECKIVTGKEVIYFDCLSEDEFLDFIHPNKNIQHG